MLTNTAHGPFAPALALAGAAWLAGCAGEPVGPQPAPPDAAAPVAVPAKATVFHIDPAATRVLVLVHRAGPLQRFGHNHALASGTERGVIWLGESPAASGFEIHVPVSSFVVDDPQVRAAAGPEFPGAVPEDARAGTLANMLRAEVLDAQAYPEIVVRAESATGTWQQLVVHASVRLKDLRRDLDVPVELTVTADRVRATGSLQIRQTDFGITPFSVAGGAVQVADVVDVRFEIAAVR